MTTDTPRATPARAGRRRMSPHEQLFIETASLRRSAVWTKARWVVDADAAVDAAVWEAIHSGVTNRQRLFDVARHTAVTHRRAEARARRRPPTLAFAALDPAERAVEMTEAKRRVRLLLDRAPAPSPGVAEWLDRKTGETYGAPLSNRVKAAGSRWAARARAELEACDEVA